MFIFSTLLAESESKLLRTGVEKSLIQQVLRKPPHVIELSLAEHDSTDSYSQQHGVHIH